MKIEDPCVFFDFQTGRLKAEKVVSSVKKIKHLSGVFLDKEAFDVANPEETVYEVEALLPVEEGKKGGLFWGVTRIFPGKVSREYFMTRGHFHAQPDTSEFYWGIQGEGVLICMDSEGNIRAEKVQKGSLHYIPGRTAHRVANTGTEILVFGACWHADAGHDYQTIEKNGFSARLVEENGQPVLIKSNAL
jgi:glucose-6-phosphate isomerase